MTERWTSIEELSFGPVGDAYMLSLARDLAGLARRAKESDQLLYCMIIM